MKYWPALKFIGYALGMLMLSGAYAHGAPIKLVHAVGFMSTSEVAAALKTEFERYYKQKSGQDVEVEIVFNSLHGQIQQMRDGILKPDVVSTAERSAMDAIAAQTGAIPANWSYNLPNSASPYATAVVMMVRHGNPKNIRNGNDLARHDVALVSASPISSGFGRAVYYNLYYYAWQHFDGDQEKIRAYIKDVYDHIMILTDSGQASLLAFELGNGDVLPVWESEILHKKQQDAEHLYEFVAMPTHFMSWPRLAIAERNAQEHGVLDVSQEYIAFIFSEQGQQIIARHHLRPAMNAVWKQHREAFAESAPIDSTLASNIYETMHHDFQEGGWLDVHLQKRKHSGSESEHSGALTHESNKHE